MKIVGYDKWGGGSRWLTAATDGPLVEISVEGSEGNGTVMLTPEQVRHLADGLVGVAKMAAGTTMLEES